MINADPSDLRPIALQVGAHWHWCQRSWTTISTCGIGPPSDPGCQTAQSFASRIGLAPKIPHGRNDHVSGSHHLRNGSRLETRPQKPLRPRGRLSDRFAQKRANLWRGWHAAAPSMKKAPFHRFHFRCKKCRLVSYCSNSDNDESHARIGEFRERDIRLKRGSGKNHLLRTKTPKPIRKRMGFGQRVREI